MLWAITRPDARIDGDLRALDSGTARMLTLEDGDWPLGRLTGLGVPLALWVRGSLGVDEAAQRGALAADGRTIVVLANGVDRTHPHQHARLYQAVIEQGGSLVSEYPIGTTDRIRFHARCRLWLPSPRRP